MIENKTRKKASRLATLLAGTLGLVGGGLATSETINPLFDSTVSVQADGKSFEVPMYSWRRVRPGRCAAYARMAAEELFGKEYSYSDGWDRQYNDKVVSNINNNENLRNLERQGILEPGMMIGAYYPNSPYLGKTDSHGNEITYTHNLIYLGKNPEGQLIFVDQAKIRTQVRTLEDWNKVGIEARYIFDIKVQDQKTFKANDKNN
jgi:hypothetical protein